MKTLSLTQGSELWLQTRLTHFTASEAPAMMGKSKYQKRSELLHLKSTGEAKAVDDFTQRLFDKGHETEELARPFAEVIIGEEIYTSTGSELVDSIPLLASFDGITMDESILFEHKIWNEKLAQSISDGKIDQHYLWQIGQQLLVSGAEKCLFMTSDGTKDNQAWCWITPDGEFSNGVLPLTAMKGMGGLGDNWKTDLLAGWVEFQSDLATYEPPLEVEADEAIESLLVEYGDVKELADSYAKTLKALKADIEKAAKSLGAKTIHGTAFDIVQGSRVGSVNYKSIPALADIDLDSYRAPDSITYTIKKLKSA